MGDDLVLEGLKQLFKDWQVHVFSNNNRGVYPMIDFDAVNKCDLFVLGGGEIINRDSLFMESPSFFNRKIPSLSYKIYGRTPFAKWSWVHRIKIPKVILGCGVNVEDPFELSRWVVNGLQQFDYIGLRDNVAVNILRCFPQLRSKVHFFPDLALAFNSERYVWSWRDNLAVVIPTDRKELGTVEKSKRWLKRNLEQYDRCVFVPFGKEDNNDYATCQRLVSCGVNSEVLNSVNLHEAFKLISNCAAVYPYRLHGLVAAFMVGAPCYPYPYHWKLRRVWDAIYGKSLDELRLLQGVNMESFLN